jgi:spore germination cell wall hydrolase CwlJ-like protein
MLLKFKNYFALVLIVCGFTMTFNITSDFKNLESNIASHVSLKQITCLAKNIFYEAGHESTEGKAAVARVVVNRMNHGFGSTPCQVVYQTTYVNSDEGKIKVCQFSWVCEGRGDPNTNDPRYVQSMNIAYDVLANNSYNDILPKSALFFHNLSVNVDNSWPYRKIKQIGNHIFYSKQNGKNK